MFESRPLKPRPDYDKRITDPTKLTLSRVVRRYFMQETFGWHHADYVIAGPVHTQKGHLRVLVRELGGSQEQTIVLADMGIVPRRGGKFSPVAYTVPL